jgi:hypothetical protein
MLGRIGVLGIIGMVVFLVWFVGWMFMGKSDGLWHVLILAGIVLMMGQAVRRVVS